MSRTRYILPDIFPAENCSIYMGGIETPYDQRWMQYVSAKPSNDLSYTYVQRFTMKSNFQGTQHRMYISRALYSSTHCRTFISKSLSDIYWSSGVPTSYIRETTNDTYIFDTEMVPDEQFLIGDTLYIYILYSAVTEEDETNAIGFTVNGEWGATNTDEYWSNHYLQCWLDGSPTNYYGTVGAIPDFMNLYVSVAANNNQPFLCCAHGCYERLSSTSWNIVGHNLFANKVFDGIYALNSGVLGDRITTDNFTIITPTGGSGTSGGDSYLAAVWHTPTSGEDVFDWDEAKTSGGSAVITAAEWRRLVTLIINKYFDDTYASAIYSICDHSKWTLTWTPGTSGHGNRFNHYVYPQKGATSSGIYTAKYEPISYKMGNFLKVLEFERGSSPSYFDSGDPISATWLNQMKNYINEAYTT